MKFLKITQLKPYPKNARTHSAKQIRQIARSIKEFGFTNPILIDAENNILAGHGRLEAAKLAGLTDVPCLCITHLTPAQKKAYILADNRLAELSGWDNDLLRVELEEIQALDLNFDATITGFDTPQIDILLAPENSAKPEKATFLEKEIPKRVQRGDLWQLGPHKLFCGDSTQESSYRILLGNEKADIVISDPPYNVSIGNIRSTGPQKEFAMASGEMTEAEFTRFLHSIFKLSATHSKLGSLHYYFMDFRHIAEMMSAGKAVFTEFKNLCIWNKLSGGMGSLYRSQHELVFVFKNGKGPHINNIELGGHGRYRTNVWDYPGIFINNKVNKANIHLHPTVKPVGLLVDILLDASPRDGVVLDMFGGSGSTLLAANRVGRKAHLIEIDEHYCDVILHRYQESGGKDIKLLKRGTLANENKETQANKQSNGTGNSGIKKRLFIRRRVL